MKHIITTIAMVLSTASLAQGIKELHFVVTPTYSSRYLVAEKDVKDFLNDIEEATVSYDLGILIYPFTGKRFSLGTGLVYSRKGYFWANHSGRGINGNSGDIKIRESVNYFEIPVRILYHLSEDAKTYVLLGLCNDIQLSSEIKVYHGQYSLPDSKIRPYNLGINFGFGHKFRISDSIGVGVEPNIKFHTMPYANVETLGERYLYTIGLSVIANIKV